MARQERRHKNKHHDVDALQEAARGHWADILSTIGGVDADALDGQHHPCPKCGGTDRFRFSNMGGNGSVYCNQCGKGIGDGLGTLQWLHGWTFPQTLTAVAGHLHFDLGGSNGNGNGRSHGRNGDDDSRIVTTYDYRDESGGLLYQAVRLEPKSFRQRRPNPDTKSKKKWLWSVKGTRLVPYRLPEMLAAASTQPVVIVEGEKDADRLAGLGIVATTNVAGACHWRREYAEHFSGRAVVILPDNDQPGRDHARQVAASLHGVARAVKIVELPGLAEKGDVSDWLDQGGTIADLAGLIREATVWSPPAKEPHDGQAGTDGSIQPPGIDDPEGRTEVANGRRFAQRHVGSFRWCPALGWLAWDGRRWAQDSTRQVETAAKTIHDRLWADVAEFQGDSDTYRAMASFARSSGKAIGVSAMLRLACSEPGIPIQATTLDADPWLFNCENGTVDLRTGELRPHAKADCITKIAPTVYSPEATCPTWLAFLGQIMGGQADVIEFLQRAVGMSISGAIREHALLVLYGTGQNGKSTFLNTLQAVIGGDYAMKAPLGMLMARPHENHPTERADLRGRRFVTAIEVEEGSRIAESLVKELTGGDIIRARFMRQDFFEFSPTHHIWLAVNHRPEVRGTDAGIWRRIKLVPFSVSIPADRQDRELPEKLLAERSGILAWAVRGAMQWAADGLRDPQEVSVATSEYRGEQDVLGAFLEECCELCSGRFGAMDFRVTAAGLYRAYVDWCEKRGEYAVKERRFREGMTERGIQRERTMTARWYVGLRLVDKNDTEAESLF